MTCTQWNTLCLATIPLKWKMGFNPSSATNITDVIKLWHHVENSYSPANVYKGTLIYWGMGEGWRLDKLQGQGVK